MDQFSVIVDNAGEQYVSGLDDMVESLCWLEPSILGEIWFERFKSEMNELDKLAKMLYGCVISYCKALSIESSNYAARATHLFWQLCERQAQALLDDCDKPDICHQLRRQFASYCEQVFDQICLHQTARQLNAWAKAKPNLAIYLKQDKA
ncbi:hypothetical protein [Arsenophonus nasoniae]|uniref:Uncharacterized protein n=1 Tax=Arsenophonus nasoniae TaxID=638 RepID=A0AA95GB25_9GAMM|nr:hypothetical protein [Arsenophonus nasoniae]WGL94867.1 hypothetical protein QE207_14425 [Arsenophonus nasoniae]